MIEYRITRSRKPTIRLWKVENRRKHLMAEVEKRKAELLEEILLRNLPLSVYMRFRDGRVIYTTDEENALRLFIALKGVIGLRSFDKVNGLLEAVKEMDRGEVFWWYSLYLKLGPKAILSLRAAYT